MRRPWLWAAAGGAALGIIVLARRARAAAPTPAPSPAPFPPAPAPAPSPTGFDPTKTYGETTRVTLAVPSGWRRATSAEVSALPELLTSARELRASSGFLDLPYGTLIPFTASDGKMYALWVEQHYHEPGGPVKPWGYHKGVTVLAKK
jgi:hypothetical protein